jgi:hypothetical protein
MVWLDGLLATVCDLEPELPAKFESPSYDAVTVFIPAAEELIQQPPAATVVVQLALPSFTVTFPVGVPPELVTVKLTA